MHDFPRTSCYHVKSCRPWLSRTLCRIQESKNVLKEEIYIKSWVMMLLCECHRHTRRKELRRLPLGALPMTFPISTSDALPLSYRRLMTGQAIQVGPWCQTSCILIRLPNLMLLHNWKRVTAWVTNIKSWLFSKPCKPKKNKKHTYDARSSQ